MSESKEIERQIAIMVMDKVDRHIKNVEGMMQTYALQFAEDPKGTGKHDYDLQRSKQWALKQLKKEIVYGFNNFKLESTKGV
jgi:hypothetical protein